LESLEADFELYRHGLDRLTREKKRKSADFGKRDGRRNARF